MIEKVNWDSDFFGYNVGKLNVYSVDDYNNFLKENKNEYKLIYLFSKTELKLENQNIKKVDNKLTFIKVIENQNIENVNNSIKELTINSDNFESILELAYLSGIYSRFKLDNNFKNEEFKKLYKVWITNSNQKKIIVKCQNESILGFVLYSIDKDKAIIELISVSESTQGQGIASELIHEIEKIGQKNNCKSIEVVTQGNNLPAINLYKKNNFNLFNSVLIYHYWNT